MAAFMDFKVDWLTDHPMHKKKPPRSSGGINETKGVTAYMRSIIASPNPEQETSVAPSIKRAKS